jgi:hypothetical protein
VLCLCPVLILFGVRLGSLPLALVAGSYGGCVHWTPPFLVDPVYHILGLKFQRTIIPKVEIKKKAQYIPLGLLKSILHCATLNQPLISLINWQWSFHFGRYGRFSRFPRSLNSYRLQTGWRTITKYRHASHDIFRHTAHNLLRKFWQQRRRRGV